MSHACNYADVVLTRNERPSTGARCKDRRKGVDVEIIIRNRCDSYRERDGLVSVQALSWVLDHSDTKSTDRLVMISLANHSSERPVDGAWESWPGVTLIAKEAGLDRERTVQSSIARMIKNGQIERRVNGAPDERIPRDRRPNLYRILIDGGVSSSVTPPSSNGVTPQARRGDARRHNGVTRGDITGCRPTTPKPSVEPSEKPSKEPGTTQASSATSKRSKRPQNPIAKAVVDAVWLKLDPKPAVPFVAIVNIATSLLDAGWSSDEIERAMITVPTISVRWCEAELRRGSRSRRRVPALPPEMAAGVVEL